MERQNGCLHSLAGWNERNLFLSIGRRLWKPWDRVRRGLGSISGRVVHRNGSFQREEFFSQKTCACGTPEKGIAKVFGPERRPKCGGNSQLRSVVFGADFILLSLSICKKDFQS